MLVPGEKLCCDCIINLQKSIVQAPAEGSSTNSSRNETEPPVFYSPEKTFDLNSTLSSICESPVNFSHWGLPVNE